MKKNETKTINQQIETVLGQTTIRYSDTIHCAHNLVTGISGWYKSYIVSEDFQKLEPEAKKESFEIFEELHSMFDSMEYKINEIEPSIEQYLNSID